MELQELKQNIDLEIFISAHGYEKDKIKSTRKVPVYRSGSEVLVLREGKDCKTYYKSGAEERGTIIDFIINRPELLTKYGDNNIYEKVRKCLSDFLNTGYTPTVKSEQIKEEKEFDPKIFFIPDCKDINNRDFYYLKFRGISQETLNSPVFENVGIATIENEEKKTKYNNVAFPFFDKDNTLKAIDFRYCIADKSYKAFSSGSDKKHSIGISSKQETGVKELFLCESPIDAMSHYQLSRRGNTEIQYIYFNGTITCEQIEAFLFYFHHLKTKNDIGITIGFDNDTNKYLIGQGYTTSILCSILTGSPIPLSYASDNKFSFIINKNIIENKNLFQKYLKGIEDITFQVNNNSFSFLFPREKALIEKINNRLATTCPKVKIAIPITKDWNDDLKLKSQTVQNISKAQINKL